MKGFYKIRVEVSYVNGEAATAIVSGEQLSTQREVEAILDRAAHLARAMRDQPEVSVAMGRPPLRAVHD
jgi:malonyl CoA-acyl carrier protein transacylase